MARKPNKQRVENAIAELDKSLAVHGKGHRADLSAFNRAERREAIRQRKKQK